MNKNNESNGKLPEHKIKCICDSCDEIRAYAEDYARDAIALNTTGVDAQGAVAEVCEDSTGCKYLNWSVDWFEDHKELPPVGTKLYDHPAPTGAYGVATELYDALTELVYHDGNKWRVGIIPDADVTDIVGAVMTKAARSLLEGEKDNG